MHDQQPVIESAAVGACCANLTGVRVTRIEPLAGSVGNQDFMVVTDAGDYVLKAGPGARLAAEAWACERVRHEGVAAPEIVALEAQSNSLAAPFLVMRRLPGEAVTESSHAALAQAGRQLRLTHTIPLRGYGALEVGGDTAVGEHPRWASFVDDVTSGLDELVAGGVLRDSFAAAATETLNASDAVRFCEPPVLLHGDLKLAHIFAHAGQYVGIIDWGDASAGDPRFDLARMAMATNVALSAFLTGYEEDLTPELSRSFTAYQLVWDLGALRYEYRSGGDWFDVYRDRAAAAVRSLA